MSSCRRSLAALLAATVAIAGSGAASAQTAEKRADDLFSKSQKAFADGRYQDAIEALHAAYVYTPRPVFLYSLGQAYRLAHDCKEAVKAYREFINIHPSKAQTTAAEQNIARCAQEDPSSVAVEPAPAPAPVVAPEPVQPASHADLAVTQPPPPKPKPTYKKWWPWTIAGVAVVGVGLGVGLGLGLHHGSDFHTTLPSVGPGSTTSALTIH